jgi:hypothetical protein
MPSGGNQTCVTSTNETPGGTADGLIWNEWSNETGGCMTTYSNATAFSSTWTSASSSTDFQAKFGLNLYTAFANLGTITAQFAETKTATAATSYSSIGVYGWSASDPCVEYYIVEDSFNGVPRWMGTSLGQVTIDDGVYDLYSIMTGGTGGANACSSPSQLNSQGQWAQYWSVRQTQRQCGTISVSQHFAAWAAHGMPLGNMLQAQILVEVGAGSGTIDFPTANVTMN